MRVVPLRLFKIPQIHCGTTALRITGIREVQLCLGTTFMPAPASVDARP